MPQPEDRVESALELLEGFLNTVDVESGTDALAEPGGAAHWFAEQGLLPPAATVDEEERDLVVALRAVLRDLAAGHHQGEVPAPAVERFSALARRLPLHAAADPAGHMRLSPRGEGAEGAAARIVGAVLEADLVGAWPRVKICPADECAWAFIDRSKNRSRRWCAMGTCGNRQKTRAYRERHRDQQGADA